MSDPFKETAYKKNFLTKVIARVDFLNPFPGLETAIPTPLTDIALRAFPIAEPREGVEKTKH